MDTILTPTKYEKIQFIKNKLYNKYPFLMNIEIGQRFHSKYYGIIIATQANKIKTIYDIYGFDVDKGLPRSGYYPIDFTLLGKQITLSLIVKCIYDGDIFFHNYVKRVSDSWDVTNDDINCQIESTIGLIYEILLVG